MGARFSESVVEDAALAWLEALGYAVSHGPEIAADQVYGPMVFASDVVQTRRVR